MKISDLVVGKTYNLNTVKNIKDRGILHTSLYLNGKIRLEDAMSKEDVFSLFYDFSNEQFFSLEDATFLVFKDIYDRQLILVEQFIEEDSPELTNLYPIDYRLYEMDRSKMADLEVILNKYDFKFTKRTV